MKATDPLNGGACRAFLKAAEIMTFSLPDDGAIPNSRLPLLIYRSVVDLTGSDPAAIFEQLFGANEWSGAWRDGIYSYHHYHSTAHEVLGVYRGWVKVQFGGENGIEQRIQSGDVVVIPAGVAHKNLSSASDLRVVGAYPKGQDWDLCYGKAGERPKADENIARVALPKLDPAYGPNGPLFSHWRP